MHDSYIIHGGRPLVGEVELSGAKNASIKLMIASLLFDYPTILHRVPDNGDNRELADLLTELGVTVQREGHRVTVDPRGITSHEVSLLYGSKVRSSFLLFGPLLTRFGRARIPNPGGCRIGARPIERIVQGMQELGAEIRYDTETGYYEAGKLGSIQGEYTFVKPTHTGTEALILLAVCGGGEVTLHNCALEPEIDDLILFLNDGGASIQRNQRDIRIQSAKRLHAPHPHTVVVDRNEAVTYAAMAYATGGDITIPHLPPALVRAFLDKIQQAGGGIQVMGDEGVRFFHTKRLRATDIETAPHPGYMTDWQPQWGLLMSTAEGTSVIHETMLEARLNYVQELQKVGAQIEFFQPKVQDPRSLYQFNYDPNKTYQQAVRITGVPKLHNGAMTVHDLRAGAVVVMAALSAEGESVVNGAAQIERGYENLLEKLHSLGGSIQKV